MKIERLYIVTKPGPAALVVDDLCYGNGLTVSEFQLCTLGGLRQDEVAAVFTDRVEQRAHARELLIAKLEARRRDLLAIGKAANGAQLQALDIVSDALIDALSQRAIAGFFGEEAAQ